MVMVVEILEVGIRVEMADVGRWASGWRWWTWGGGHQGGDGGHGEVEKVDMGRWTSGWRWRMWGGGHQGGRGGHG